MTEVKWVKLEVDMFDNSKIKYIRKLPQGDSILLVWIMLLTMAGKCNAGGFIFITKDIPYTEQSLADEIGMEQNTVKLALEAFRMLNMVDTNNGLRISGWEEHQSADRMEELKEAHRERQRAYRDRKKLSSDVTVMSRVTGCDRVDKDKDKDKDIDKDIDKDKENNESNQDIMYSTRAHEETRKLGKPVDNYGGSDVYICPWCGRETYNIDGKCVQCGKKIR